MKGVKQLDHGIGDTFVYVRTGRDLYGRSSKNLVRSVREWLLDSEKDRRGFSTCYRKMGLSLAKLAAVVEPVESDFGILADLDEVAVGITHIAAPFPAVIV